MGDKHDGRGRQAETAEVEARGRKLGFKNVYGEIGMSHEPHEGMVRR